MKCSVIIAHDSNTSVLGPKCHNFKCVAGMRFNMLYVEHCILARKQGVCVFILYLLVPLTSFQTVGYYQCLKDGPLIISTSKDCIVLKMLCNDVMSVYERAA